MIRVCTAMARGKICGKRMAWTKHPDRWSGTCRCGLQRRASTAEAAELDVLAAGNQLAPAGLGGS